MTNLDEKMTNSGWVILELIEERNHARKCAKMWEESSAVWKESSAYWWKLAGWEEEMGKREAERSDKLLAERELFTTIAKITVKYLCDCSTLRFEFDPSRHSSGCAYRVAVEKEMKCY